MKQRLKLFLRKCISSLMLGVCLVTLGVTLIACSPNNGSLDIEPRTPKFEGKKYTYSIRNQILVEFINVGQGDSIFIKQGDSTMLVDTGKYSEYDNVVSTLSEYNVSSLDYFVVTHMDADHMQSASDIITDYSVDTLLCSNELNKDTQCVEYLNKSIHSVNTVEYPKAGDSFQLGDARVVVLAPLSNKKNQYKDSNEYSIVLKIIYGDTSYLLTGDATGKEYELSKEKGYNFNADVVKLMHHGSCQNGSNSEDFIKTVNPSYVVVSCGFNNEYGHPHKEIMDYLKDKKIYIFRTDLQGDIISTSDGNNIWFNLSPSKNYNNGNIMK